MTGTIDQLTARERDCLRLVARGMSSKEIALTLGLSPLTVDGYLKEAARTLGVSSRREAARILAAHEHLSPQAPETPPQNLGAEPVDLAETVHSEVPLPPKRSEAEPRFRVPFLRQGKQTNDLDPFNRLMWIFGLALLMLIAVANFLNGLGALWRITG
ncbi:helix-turn-helix transcriptional regulator [Sphingomonas sp. CBMAI 2297]|uniref:helix-turn-helix domain-containing protein n=1 Tax=Sphingomonas sp. CBMAI 2297 TaxID=2991720 RepID=UPI0024587085|nr:helix-turn-helix transcriptional regulator [Sphingomonas sp. CBMAI 2297]MDH4744584.1 helix-turn-helix transcriptional regulator [Sphingomonas sp. CBMAI 2297]